VTQQHGVVLVGKRIGKVKEKPKRLLPLSRLMNEIFNLKPDLKLAEVTKGPIQEIREDRTS
jgi:hypothetical protein